jgi:hypothetical protein
MYLEAVAFPLFLSPNVLMPDFIVETYKNKKKKRKNIMKIQKKKGLVKFLPK